MSHIHIPDGVLPLWLVGAGWVVTLVLLAVVSRSLGGAQSARQLPRLGVIAAIMLVGMSTEIVPIAYHVNLSVLAGLALGPRLAFLAAFVVNLILALFGHGGITVAGLNTLVLAAEAALGYYLFRWVGSLLRSRRPSPAVAGGLATILALALSSMLMVGIVGLAELGPSVQAASAFPEDLGFRNPLEHGLLGSELLAAEEGQVPAAARSTDLATFAKLVLLFGIVGWTIEALLTGAIVGYLSRVRPDLVGGRSRGSIVVEERPG